MHRSLRNLLVAAIAIGAIASVEACESTNLVTVATPPDTVIVESVVRRVDTTVVLRVDTTYVPRPETTFVQRPGRVDTVVVVRRDTTYIPRVDTLIVVTKDTVIVHDTVTRVDTVWRSRVPVYVCLSFMHGDTLFALNSETTVFCDADHLAPQFPGAKVLVNVVSGPTPIQPTAANGYRGTRLLPGFMTRP